MEILILVSRFNSNITENLLQGACHYLRSKGHPDKCRRVYRVPGAFELAQAASMYLHYQQQKPDAIIALGAVIRGQTPHFDYVCSAASAGLNRLATEHSIPIGFGLITADDMQQAEQRSSTVMCSSDVAKLDPNLELSNKGYEAAAAVWQMLDLRAQFAR